MIDRFASRAISRRGPSRMLLAACLAWGVAVLAGCSKTSTSPDLGYTMPEGIVDSVNIQMIVWADQPTEVYVYQDRPPADPDETDSLETTAQFRRYAPGTIQGMILDHSVADGYRMYRREPGGGVRLFSNVTVPRTRRWVESQYEAYHFVDPAPSGYSPASYIGRGIVEGIVNQYAPLTPMVDLTSTSIGNIDLNAVWYKTANAIKLKWTPVAGAKRYLLHIYDFRSDLRTAEEAILSGTPAPLYDGLSTDYYVGYVDPGISFMLFPDPNQTGLTTFLNRPIEYASPVKVRLTALDDAGKIIATTRGKADPIEAWLNGDMGLLRGGQTVFGIIIGTDETYTLYRLGSTTARDTVQTGPPGGGGIG